MRQASAVMHSKMEKAQKDHVKVRQPLTLCLIKRKPSLTPSPSTGPRTNGRAGGSLPETTRGSYEQNGEETCARGTNRGRERQSGIGRSIAFTDKVSKAIGSGA